MISSRLLEEVDQFLDGKLLDGGVGLVALLEVGSRTDPSGAKKEHISTSCERLIRDFKEMFQKLVRYL